jgi:hypothetical protein
MPLVPLYPERDSWLKDYTGFITAYQNEMHCVGIVKHILNTYAAGQPSTAEEIEHANQHCMEVIRQAIMCHPDLQLSINWDGKHRGPMWGGQKHQCRDQKMVHEFLAGQNLGFKTMPGEVDENGNDFTKVWSWPLLKQTNLDTAGPMQG